MNFKEILKHKNAPSFAVGALKLTVGAWFKVVSVLVWSISISYFKNENTGNDLLKAICDLFPEPLIVVPLIQLEYVKALLLLLNTAERYL